MIISNNLIGKMPISDNAIIRINLAWIKSKKEAKKLLDKSKHEIYLDYPSGRTKPPTPVITLTEAIEIANHPNVRYFAMSNCENPYDIYEIVQKLDVDFVAKIETERGVKNMQSIREAGASKFMLDKEDLYVNVGCDNDKYNDLIKEARKHKGVMELQGVVFI